MNFRKTSEWGGGHFRSEKFRCGFSGNFGAVKTMNFRKKGGGHANPNEFRCKFLGLPKKAQHCFPKIGLGGVRGRLEVFRKFIEFGTGSLPLVGPWDFQLTFFVLFNTILGPFLPLFRP